MLSKRILVINAGSTSLKYKVFNYDNLAVIQENNFLEISNQTEAIKTILREIENLSEVVAVGHRVVHGGREFTQPTVINVENLRQMAKYNSLAPLHNPFNLSAIKICQEYLPDIPNLAVFDTAFFKDLPDKAKIYGLPYNLYTDYGFQRFGFHGLSHQYAAEQAAEILRKPLTHLKVITCHLGGGASISAIEKGRAIDTSMGFTPIEGLLMLTRSGDLDPGLVLELMKILKQNREDNPEEKIIQMLNFESGIKGLSGIDDYLELLKELTFGNEKAKLAFDIFIYRIKKYIGAYFAVLNGCDALVFTGAIGAGRAITREKICENMKILDKVQVLKFPADEEKQIAKEIKKSLNFN